MKSFWNIKEWIVITALWGLIFAYDPLYLYYAHIVSDFNFEWSKVLGLWGYDAAFLVVFLLHHYLLLPRLIDKKNTTLYMLGTGVCVVAFTLFVVLYHPNMNGHEDIAEHRTERTEMRKRPPLLSPPDLGRVAIVILMIGADLGLVAWAKSQRMRERLMKLEQQNLKQELEHLRYQINPHFFMNTLNNIHALVDLDQERAKRAIIELSGLMRYALYEGDSTLVNLSHEVEFLKLYISLMKLRYSDKVQIVCDMPQNAQSDIMISPMLLATFVENAFKHGVSYLSQSYIHVGLTLDDERQQICFRCVNSRHNIVSSTSDGHHGLGLENVRKRLDLQYADSYRLNIDDRCDDKFAVELILPYRSL